MCLEKGYQKNHCSHFSIQTNLIVKDPDLLVTVA